MTTLDGLARAKAQDRAAAAQRRRQAHAQIDALIATANAEGRDHLTPDESALADHLLGARDTARRQMRALDSELANLAGLQAEEAAYQARAAVNLPVALRSPDSMPGGAGGTRPAVTGGGGEFRVGESPSRSGGDSPRWVRTGDLRPAVVERGQRFADHPVAQDQLAASAARDQAVIGQHGGFGQLVRSMSTTSGSALVPTVWSADIIDRARNFAAVVQAGAELVPMDAKIVQIGRLTADPTASFRAEGSPVTASDPVFDNVTLTAKTLSALVVGSMEWFQDAANVNNVVSDAVAKAIALQLDLCCLFGGITAGNELGAGQVPAGGLASPPNPVGILASLLANYPGNVLGAATNGTAITAATPWNELLDTWFTPMDGNEQPNAILLNSRMARKYAKTYDTLGQPLRIPADLDPAVAPRFVTNQIPSFTAGTMANIATDIFGGDFRQLIVGHRLDLTVQTLTERYAENGQVAIVAHWRGDVAVARPRAFCVYRYIGGV
jgi:HK97 family phage major capsid protein